MIQDKAFVLYARLVSDPLELPVMTATLVIGILWRVAYVCHARLGRILLQAGLLLALPVQLELSLVPVSLVVRPVSKGVLAL